MRLALLFGLLAGVLVMVGLGMHLNVMRGLIGLAVGGAVGFVLSIGMKRLNSSNSR